MSHILVDKSHTAGFYVSAGELLKALKDKVFKNSPDEAPVFIHQTSGIEDYEVDSQPLTAVLFCGSCDKLHLQSGWYDTANEVLTKNAVIYQDYRDREDRYIIRKELIEILTTIPKDTKIIIATTGDESLTILTTVLKCSDECPSVHLLGGYTNEAYNPN